MKDTYKNELLLQQKVFEKEIVPVNIKKNLFNIPDLPTKPQDAATIKSLMELLVPRGGVLRSFLAHFILTLKSLSWSG